MKMIKAIIRPEKELEVIKGLEKSGFYSLTKMDVLGRGRQRGVKVGNITYDEIAKLMLMLVVEDKDASKVLDVIQSHARTGNFGDGKVFISEVREAHTIRTGKKSL